MEQRIAIVGAGMAGLGAAWRLGELGLGDEVVVFEKSRGFGGRVATRTCGGVRVDLGANYFRLGEDGFGDVVRDVLGGRGVVEIGKPVWVLRADGSVVPGDEGVEDGGKWVYADGISTVAKRLVAESGVTVVRETRVERVEHRGGRWGLVAEGGAGLGEFDVVLWTAPVPQVVEVMRRAPGGGMPGWWGGLADRLDGVEFLPQFSVALGYREAPERPGRWYGVVNADRGHDIGWMSFEDDKGGRVAAGESVLVAQMSPRWTRAHFDCEREAVAGKVVAAVASVLGEAWGEPDWWNVQRWKFAQPAGGGVEPSGVVSESEADGWFVAGDGVVGKARVGLAFENGVAAAERIGGRLR